MTFYIGKKKPQHYNNLLIKADLGLHDQIATELLGTLPKNAKILDLGAGEGALSERLADLGFHVTAADKDEENFKSTKASFTKINFDSLEDIQVFTEKHQNEFDAVLGIEVIEHVQDQWQYVRQLMQMVKKDGLILITTPNTASWLSRVLFLLSGRFHQFSDADLSYGHINPISEWELNLILKETGATDIKTTPAGTLPALYLSNFKTSLLSFLMLPLRPFMKGIIDGWCIMAVAKKPS